MTYHQLMEQIHIRPSRTLFNPHFGQIAVQRAGTSDDFLQYKTYKAGDSLKHIDWKRFLKEKKLYTKAFGEENDFTIVIAIDTSRSMLTDDKCKIKLQNSLLQAIAYNALYNNHSLVLMDLACDESLQVDPSLTKGILQIEKWLETRTYERDGLLLKSGLHQTYKSVFFILLSDCWSEEVSAFIKGQDGLKNDFLCIRILSEEEKSPSLNGHLLLKDAESNQSLKIKVTPEILNQYKKLLKEDTLKLQQTCLQHGYRFYEWVTRDDIKPLLIRLGR